MEKYPLKNMGIDNIEVEDKETILLSIGELFEVTGKTHKQGGEDVYAPDGTRIFSAHLKADKDLASKITGKKHRSEKSFAELSKMYDPNPYKKLMESDDELTARTAELMFNKINGQLDNIFYAQESLKAQKGLPNDTKNLSFQPGGTVGKPKHTFPIPNEAQTLFDQFGYEFDQGALDPINIPSVQHRNKVGTYGRTRDVKEFQQYNQWYFKDRPHFDVTNPESVLNYQQTYNKELERRYGDNPELVKSMKLVEDGKFGEATSRTTLPDRDLPIPGKLESLETKPFEINEQWDFQRELAQIPMEETQKTAPVGIDPMALSDAMKTGLGLSELLSLQKENPYYAYSGIQAPLQRFNPINTLGNERAYNVQKENLESSGVPEHVKQALLTQGQAKFQDGVNQVALSNYQGDNQIDNANTSAIIAAYNQNADRRNQANYQYVQESAIRDNNYDLTRQELLDRLFTVQDDKNYRQYSRELMGAMSPNFEIDKRGRVRYTPGSKADASLSTPLKGYERIDKDAVASMSKAQLQLALNKILEND